MRRRQTAPRSSSWVAANTRIGPQSRPRSGRRSWTSTPRGARCSRRRRRSCWVLSFGRGWGRVRAPGPVARWWTAPRAAQGCRSSLRRCRARHGVLRRDAEPDDVTEERHQDSEVQQRTAPSAEVSALSGVVPDACGLHVRAVQQRGRAPRGVAVPDGGERPSRPCRRSGGVKLAAVDPGGRRGRWEQPRRSRDGPALPDGSGPVSETGRYTRETGVVTPLDVGPALTRWIRAGVRCVPIGRHGGGD